MDFNTAKNQPGAEPETRVGSDKYENSQEFWHAIAAFPEKIDAKLDEKPATSEEIEAAKVLAHKYLIPDYALRDEEETIAILKQVHTSRYDLDKELPKAMEHIHMDDLRIYGSLVNTEHRVVKGDGGLAYDQEFGSPLSGHFDFEHVSPHMMHYDHSDIAEIVNDSVKKAKDYIRRIIVYSRDHDSIQ